MSAKRNAATPTSKSNTSPAQSKTSLFDKAFYVFLALVALMPSAIGVLPGGFAWAGNALFAPRIFILTVLTATSFILWAVSVYTEKTPIRLHKALWVLLGLMVLTLLSSVFAKSPLEAFFGGYDNPIGFLTYASLSVLLFLTIQFLATQNALVKLTKTVAYSALVPATLAWISRIFLIDPFKGVSFAVEGDPIFMITRGMGTFGNPDFLGNYIVLPAILALGLFAASRTAKEQIINGVTFLVLTSTLIGTATRGAIIGFVVAVIILGITCAIKKYPLMRPAILVTAVLVVSIAVAIPISAQANDPILMRLFGIETGLEQFKGDVDLLQAPKHLGGRALFWADVPEMVAKSPVLGAGPANFTNQWRLVRSSDTLIYGMHATMSDAHNLIFQFAVTLGLPATLLAIALAVWALIGFFKAPKNPAEKGEHMPVGRIYFLAWGSGLLGLLIGSIAAMTVIVWLLLIYLSIGVLLAPSSASVSARESKGALRTASLTATTVLMVSAALWGSLWLVSNIMYASASRSTEPFDIVENAVKVSPFDLELRRTLAGFYRAKAESVTPQDQKLYFYLLDSSILHSEKLMDLSPGYYPAYENYAVARFMKYDLLGNQADFDAAKSAGEKGIELYPASVAMRTIMAQAYNQQAEYQKAYDVLREWWDADPEANAAAKEFKTAQEGLGK